MIFALSHAPIEPAVLSFPLARKYHACVQRPVFGLGRICPFFAAVGSVTRSGGEWSQQGSKLAGTEVSGGVALQGDSVALFGGDGFLLSLQNFFFNLEPIIALRA